jgi:DNA-binding transcriptional MerR regulator
MGVSWSQVTVNAEHPHNLQELAAASGVPARTIRFYITRGLLPPPASLGRGAAYTSQHLERLELIKKWRAEGLMLAEIAGKLAGDKGEAGLPEASAWWSYRLEEDVLVWVRAGTSPWRTKQLRAAIKEMAVRLKSMPEKEGDNIDRD